MAVARLSYSELLRDPRWQKVRLKTLERDDWRCRWCGDRDSNLQVDHRRYVKGRAPWEYEGSDLVTLCDGCHARITKLRARAMELFGQFNVYELPIVVATVERMLTAQPDAPEEPKEEIPEEDRGDDPMTDTRPGARHWILERVDEERIAMGLIV